MNPREVCALHRTQPLRPDPARPADARHGRLPGDGGPARPNDADGYLPVIVLTAQPGHKLRALQAGAKDFVSKPFDLVEVRTRIHNMLEVRLLYRQLENAQPAARADRAGAHRRAARKRSPLPQPDRAGVRLVLGTGRERKLHQGVRARCWRCSASGSTPWSERPADCPRDGLERGGARKSSRRRSRIAQPFLDFVFSRVNGDGSRQQFRVSGEPMFDRVRAASSATAASVSKLAARRHALSPGGRDRRCSRPHGVRARTTCWPPCPLADFERLAPHLELVPMRLGDMLYEPAPAVAACVLSDDRRSSRCTTSWSHGSSAEIAGVGNEGVVGISLFMGGDTTPSSAVVQTAGHAYRLPGPMLKEEFARGGLMQRLLLRYTQALMTQMSPDRGLQPTPHDRAAAVPMAAADARSTAGGRTRHDAGTGRQRARRAARGHHRGRGRTCSAPASSATGAGTLRCFGGRAWSPGACECYGVVKKELDRLMCDVRYRQVDGAGTAQRAQVDGGRRR